MPFSSVRLEKALLAAKPRAGIEALARPEKARPVVRSAQASIFSRLQWPAPSTLLDIVPLFSALLHLPAVTWYRATKRRAKSLHSAAMAP